MKKKFSTTFNPILKVHRIKGSEYDKTKQALASTEALVSLLPKFDKEKNPDLLAISFDVAIANIVNANDDGILTPTAKLITPNFVHKPINIEHMRSYVFGTITDTKLASFSDGAILDPNSIKDDSLEPFKICAGGVLWKCVESYMTDEIEDQNEEEDEIGSEMEMPESCCMEYCGSWEIGFDEFVLALGSKKLADAEIVTDEARVKELSKYLKAFKGPGMLPDGTPVYRIITGEVTSLGVGVTTNPAAAVDKIFAECKENKKIQKNISTEAKVGVKTNTRKIMKIKEIADITEDVMKEAHASEMRDFIKSQILAKDAELTAQKESAAKALAAVQAEAEANKASLSEATVKVTDLENRIVSLSAEIKSLQEAKAAKEAEELFNTRMSTLASKFTLDSNLEKIVHSQIKGLDQASFDKWLTDFEVLASAFKKEEKKEASGDKTEAATKIVSKASVQDKTPPNTHSGEQKQKIKVDVKFTKGTVTL